jgi:hypothetical protein
LWVHLFEPHEPYVAHPEHPFGDSEIDRYDSEIAAADAGLAVLISYACVPYDVEQACIDTMGDWFKYRERIGVTSKSIDGQSISLTNFTNTGLPVRARDALQQYKRVAPGVS